MFIAAALVPSTPLLVPELNGADATDTEPLRAAASAAAAQLGPRWTAIGVGAVNEEIRPDAAGTFAGFGVDVRVRLSAEADKPVDATLPLPALIAAWLRETSAPTASVSVQVLAPDLPPQRCADLGAALRRRLDADPRPHGLLVVADGAATLTDKAPRAFHPGAPAYQQRINQALAQGDCAAVADLDPAECTKYGVSGRAAWQFLAGVFGGSKPQTEVLYSAAPFGVGYHVGVWRP
ncbi:hypothetical protein FOS14_17030 [Skermania sp. ID1734]|uniref:class III extradiol dioxygenase subunit B-like domain-containing protein n=1 Tax=Skermania sp. ID1734 TaxID=2597516 RepID=UPI00117DA6B1|nr:class III extradiol dioxygenase subunit B-like domain-containing protein [Skermania sp. ID1734]TSD96064.1 hypothetical protein FOS14_17030 [Skermania sp. ID1734]